MRILMLNYEFPPMGGGAGNATNNISKQLAAMGHEVTVLTSHYQGLEKKEVKDGVTIFREASLRKGIHDCGFSGAYTYLISAAVRLIGLKMSRRFDVVHYFFSLPTGVLSFLPWAYRKVPYIVSLRGSDVPYYDVYNKKVHYFNLMLRPLTRLIWRRAKRVVALSDSLKQTAKKTAPAQPIAVIPNGIETDLFNPGKERQQSADRLRLITVSRLIKRKGIQHVLKALAQLGDKDVHLTVVGTGDYEDELKRLCSELRLDDVVSFYGYCPRVELPKLYNRSDVFILTSLAESFGLVFAEAMACGLPIIAAKTGGIVDLVKPANGLLVEAGDVEAIMRAITDMKTDPEMRKRMGTENYQRVLEHYSWEGVAKKYLDIYASYSQFLMGSM